MANAKHLAILRQGVETWNRWRADSPEVVPDFSHADLSDRKLSEARLSLADLTWANLSRTNLALADFTEADLTGVDLTGAKLGGANFSAANLGGANFSRADLTWADLTNADLVLTNLFRADLSQTQIGKSRFWHVSLSDLDLSTTIGLGSAVHGSPSSVGVDTLIRTLRGSGGRFTEEQLVFFEGAGVPHTLLESLPGILKAEPVQFYSCFIGYSTDDEAFADQLNHDLNKASIQTWKWNLDALAGRDLRDNIDRALTNYDKMILICSINSLTSGPVDREIEKALQKEDQLNTAKAQRVKEAFAAGEESPYVDTNVLVPIRTDDFVFHWESPLASQVKRLYIPDFTDAPPDSEKYQDELQKLIHALNPQVWPPQLAASQNT